MLKTINNNAKIIDRFLKNYFKKQGHSQLLTSMKYGVLFGGKKIRSTIIFNMSELFNLRKKDVINICGAVECIHSYSLIHDDLPCMDNDNLRRGKPASHIKFGESTAILSGNSLLTIAFEMITEKNYGIKLNKKILILNRLAEYVGHTGIAGGQFLDLSYEKKKVSISKVIEMQKKKTGKLFEFCCLAPAIISGANNKIIKEMRLIGQELGLLFQITDDLLDIKGNKKDTGKQVKKDKKRGKSTIVDLLGYNKTLEFTFKLKKMIIKRLTKYKKKDDKLIRTINFIIDRSF